MSGVVFGLSFGNCQASIAVYKNGRAEVVADEAGERTTPMMISYMQEEKLVGHSARQSLHRNSTATATHMPALLKADLSSASVQAVLKDVPSSVLVKDGRVGYQLISGEHTLFITVEEALIEIFKKLVSSARLMDSTAVSPRAVLAVPCDYTTDQRMAARCCAERAGFEVLAVVGGAPVSLLAYGLCMDQRFSGHILVYDLGMRLLTVSVLSLRSGLARTLCYKTYEGVGGALLDTALMTLLSQEFKRKTQQDLSGNRRAHFKLHSAVLLVKQTLSSQRTASVSIDSLHDGLDFQYTVTRGRFEGTCLSVFQTFTRPISEVLTEAGLKPILIDKVVLAGGSCMIPRLRELIAQELPSSQLLSSLPAEHVVAMGAAVQASVLRECSEAPPTSLPCSSTSVWLSCRGCGDPVLLLARHTPLPCVATATLLCHGSGPLTVLVEEELDNHERKSVAKVVVPIEVSQEVNQEVTLLAELLWDSNRGESAVTITVSDAARGWRETLQLDQQTSRLVPPTRT